jgi:Zn-dependent peptidase ImmA (M78 family)
MAEEKMALEPLIVGRQTGLWFRLKWRNDYDSSGSVGQSWGDLELWVGSTLVWGELNELGEPLGVRWTWIELLDFLAIAWPYLNEEELYPIDFGFGLEFPAHPGEIRGKAKLRWHHLGKSLVVEEDEKLRDFLGVHDLAEGLQGANPKSFILLRQGKQLRVATTTREWVLPFQETMDTLILLAEAILNRIAFADDSRYKIVGRRWQERDAMPEILRLQLATGLDEDTLRQVWPHNPDAKSANDAAYDLKAAARMVGTQVDASVLHTLLVRINEIPLGSGLQIGELSVLAAEMLAEYDGDKPSFQGYALAQMLREYLNIGTGPADPEKILREWGVDIRGFDMKGQGIDAVAVWGDRHRATIFLNQSGPRSKYPTGRRITYAHEICHLLVDADAGLPVAEVLGGQVARALEQRANAFAAEFLLPQAEAGRYVVNALQYIILDKERQLEIEKSVDALAKKFNVSHETTAWQIRNSGQLSSSDIMVLQPYLKSLFQPN